MDTEKRAEAIIRTSEQGDAGYIAYMHGKLYKRIYNLGGTVEYYFMKTLTDFVYDNEGGRLWIAELDGRIIGSVGIVRHDAVTAQLRWFIVEEGCQNMGVGSALISRALDFCREMGYRHIFLWTFSELHAARRLYQKAGFVLTEEKPNHEWRDDEIIEQKWVMSISERNCGLSNYNLFRCI